MEKSKNPKWWDHLLMRTQNVAGIILSVAALGGLIVLYGSIPQKQAQAESRIVNLEQTQAAMLLKMERFETRQEYTNTTLDEIKASIIRDSQARYN